MIDTVENTNQNIEQKPKRPWFVVVLAVITVLSSFTSGLGVPGLFWDSASGPTKLILVAVLCPLTMGGMWYVAWGLWNMKHWARVVFSILVIVTFFSNLSGVSFQFEQNPGITTVVLILAAAFRVAIIYYLMTSKEYVEIKGNDAKLSFDSIKTAMKQNTFLRVFIMGNLVGAVFLTLLVCGVLIAISSGALK